MNQQQFMAEFEQLRQTANWAAAQCRQLLEEARSRGGTAAVDQVVREHREMQREIRELAQVLSSLKMERVGGTQGDAAVQRIENIPGERVPFDMLVEIPILAGSTELAQQTFTVSMEGAFVAEARMATFLSQHRFQRIDPDTQAVTSFNGRTFGRLRPISSATDHNDGLLMAETTRVVAFPGTGAPSYASPSNHAPARSMQGDFRIKVLKQDSGFPRSNISVPSSFWTTYINSPFPLAALDFFPRASVVEISVTPLHVNNPAAGNLQGYGAGGVFPFLDSQFDHHEGIADPLNPALVAGDPDPITRDPKGILVIGFRGFRIQQTPGAVANLSSV